MPRGFVWAIYVTDAGLSYATRVDANYAQDPDRGWFTEGVLGLPLLPGSFRKRHVRGIDESGRIQTAVVAHLGAALWSGTIHAFVFETTDPDASLAVADVFEYVQELAAVPHA